MEGCWSRQSTLAISPSSWHSLPQPSSHPFIHHHTNADSYVLSPVSSYFLYPQRMAVIIGGGRGHGRRNRGEGVHSPPRNVTFFTQPLAIVLNFPEERESMPLRQQKN